jgi:hypothetical protein
VTEEDDETSYERMDRVLKRLGEKLYLERDKVCHGKAGGQDQYWSSVGFIRGLELAIDVITKKDRKR